MTFLTGTGAASGCARLNWRSGLAEVAILAALIVVFSILNPTHFPTLVNLNTILNSAAIPVVIGVGASLVVLTGRIDLSVEGVMGAAGMVFVLLSANSRETADIGWLAYPVAIGVGLALGAATGLVHAFAKVPSFIVSLGMWYVGLGIAAVLFGYEMIPFLSDEAAVAWPTATTFGLPNSFLLALCIVAFGWLIERYTRLGRYTRAIGNNEGVARMTGIPVAAYVVLIFAFAGACSALAGIMGSLALGAGAANVGVGMLFLTLAAIVIGGTPLGGGQGGALRTVMGVLILSTLYNGLILAGVDPSIQSGVSGVVLVVAVIAAGWSQRAKLRVFK
ncbi:ABC transporter permease [Neotabrizicola shimadae]|uniref:ABC transporter permease n=1 Tax=Neotabrizicola shimadae TaxID=2807096 RepID=A0A8G0ZWX4_9RHOB|nr:ABC transporter permease [Neotabrizicola shimadae]QYZ69534.1 ABC transporter permease [Neotabrizicola shimadae]